MKEADLVSASLALDMDAQGAASLPAAAIASAGQASLQASAWAFLSDQLSESGLLTDYLTNTPQDVPFWGTGLAKQGAAMTVPRILWPEKPNVETLVMDRVYANGVTDPSLSISAKPQFLVDGYLSFRALGVWLACLGYGLVAAWASRLAERWIGGYLIGSALVYTALFQNLLWGNCFEFVVGTAFWLFVVLWALFMLGRFSGMIVPR